MKIRPALKRKYCFSGYDTDPDWVGAVLCAEEEESQYECFLLSERGIGFDRCRHGERLTPTEANAMEQRLHSRRAAGLDDEELEEEIDTYALRSR